MPENENKPRWISPMKARPANEAHRSATPLELFFDLVFVVAIAQAAVGLHHGIAEDHTLDALISFAAIFFGIWWAWMNFTWFATTYDNGDVPYRVVVFVQLTGALIMASGVERIFTERDFSITVLGYVVMRIAQIALYLRAARDDPDHRPTTMRYAIGMGIAQVGWVLFLLLPEQIQIPTFFIGAIIELLIPIWAEIPTPTTWHGHHIRERYGLFTIIVLGESILSTSMAIQTAIDEGDLNGSLLVVIIGGILIVYSMWWLYFYQPADRLMRSLRDAFIWADMHYLIFGAIAAVGAGLAVMIDYVTHHTEITLIGAGFAVALPSAIYVLTMWVLHEHPRAENLLDRYVHPVFVFLILLTPFTGQAVILTGVLLVTLVIIRLIRHLE